MENVTAHYQLYVSVGANIDALWSFYVTVHLAIAGVLIYVKSVERVYLLSFIFGYLVFSIINYRAKSKDYQLYFSVVESLKEKIFTISDKTPLMEFFVNYDPSDRMALNVYVHLVSAIILLALTIFKYRNSYGKK